MKGKTNTKKIGKTIYLTASIWNKILKYAKKQDRPKSKIIEFAVLEYFDKRG